MKEVVGNLLVEQATVDNKRLKVNKAILLGEGNRLKLSLSIFRNTISESILSNEADVMGVIS